MICATLVTIYKFYHRFIGVITATYAFIADVQSAYTAYTAYVDNGD